MEPHWYAFSQHDALCSFDCGPVGRRKVSRNPKIRCEEGDPLAQIMDAILEQVTLLSENLINSVIDTIDTILQSIGGWIGIPRLPRVCFPIDSQPLRCEGGGLTTSERNALAACYDDNQGMQNLVRPCPAHKPVPRSHRCVCLAVLLRARAPHLLGRGAVRGLPEPV